MAISLVHVSDIHFGSGESHGRLNPETGLNVRFEDFDKALRKVVDFSIEQNVDVFLFSGDAYKNSSPEPIYQKAFASHLKRLSGAGIKIVLLVGNHDQVLRASASHSMSVFQSLEVPHLVTFDEPSLEVLQTKNGSLQVIGLPYVTKNFLMTQEAYADLSGAQLDKLLVSRVSEVLSGLYDELDPAIPCVVTAHAMVDSARAGAEQELMIGYSSSFPLSLFIDERVDYVALGHVHKHQILRQTEPMIAYAGSLERVDFSEESEDKGFLLVRIERGSAQAEFHSINPRPFITVEADLRGQANPMAMLLRRIEQAVTAGAVMRVRYQIDTAQSDLIEESALRESLSTALSAKILPEVTRVERDFRMPELDETAVAAPLQALDSYLENMHPQRKEALLNKLRALQIKLDQA